MSIFTAIGIFTFKPSMTSSPLISAYFAISLLVDNFLYFRKKIAI